MLSFPRKPAVVTPDSHGRTARLTTYLPTYPGTYLTYLLINRYRHALARGTSHGSCKRQNLPAAGSPSHLSPSSASGRLCHRDVRPIRDASNCRSPLRRQGPETPVFLQFPIWPLLLCLLLPLPAHLGARTRIHSSIGTQGRRRGRPARGGGRQAAEGQIQDETCHALLPGLST